MTKWSKEKVWEWYNSQPWIRGVNYIPSCCVNSIEQWQEYNFENVLSVIDNELALAANVGFNSIRYGLSFFIWENQHDGFMERLERFLEVCAKHHITVMFVLGNDCTVPKHNYVPGHFGEQEWDLGYHSGKKISPHIVLDDEGYSPFDEEEYAARYCEMVREIVTKYQNDERIIMWDVFNEIGNSLRGVKSVPFMKRLFTVIREIDPLQPVGACAWRVDRHGHIESEEERIAVELSDIVLWHYYGDYKTTVKIIENLKKYECPLINTEWLHRIQHNNIEEIFPLFYLERIGSYSWGLVAGKTQTYEPWEHLWHAYDHDKSLNLDFTKWQHDLFRANHRPYNPKEIEIIKEFCQLADQKYKE
ncbi:MAG: cellulase family glycosylhydrolase [Bacilli bacterium]|nr:cellulase family glycosylhydrolase [Bacilli bacterium]